VQSDLNSLAVLTYVLVTRALGRLMAHPLQNHSGGPKKAGFNGPLTCLTFSDRSLPERDVG
jgi:hypothetical protein